MKNGSYKAGLAIDSMIASLGGYARAHVEMYDSPLARDYVLGEAWLQALQGVRGLLNGELGAMDGGTLDARVLAVAKLAGFSPEEV